MAFSPLLKSLALQVPVLGQIVRERDFLRIERQTLAAEVALIRNERDALRDLIKNTASETVHSGYCHCCRQQTLFQIRGSWLRDEYVCVSCHSIPRQRHLQYILDTHFPGWAQSSIHESSPTNDLLSRWCTGYSHSHYFEGVASGAVVNGVRCEDLERMSFADASIDLFVTQDVFEHVFHPQRAAAEIARVLKPGGAHVFTVPRLAWIATSEPRAKISAAGIEHIKEESYHGNPVGDGKALVTWDYGADFETLMDEWSGLQTSTFNAVDRSRGIDGEFRDVFISKKRR